LKKEEKNKLFLAIRYSYLKHEELIELGFNETFKDAKDYIMQGLSYRLDPYEKSAFKDYKISMKPRVNYGQDMERKLAENYAKSRQDQHKNDIDSIKS
jgi:hypothetical protein